MADQKEVQRQHDQVRIARENQLARVMEQLPAFEAKMLRYDEKVEKLMAEVIDKENELKQAREMVNETFEKTEAVKELYDEHLLEVKHTQEDLDLARKHNAEWEQRLREQTEDKRPWSWKRAAWAVVSATGGLALAYWLRKKAPIINAAAGGSAIGNLCMQVKPLKGASLIGSAGGALATHWAHNEENLIGHATETILAGAGYAVPIFEIGDSLGDINITTERILAQGHEAIEAVKEGYTKTKEKLSIQQRADRVIAENAADQAARDSKKKEADLE